MPSTPPSLPATTPTIDPIDAIIVKGFKSHRDELSLTIRPLTVLCGANSSGKSSVMQALLLVKQTIDDSPRSPTLKLAGHHVVFAEGKELLWREGSTAIATTLSRRILIGLKLGTRQSMFEFDSDDRDISLNGTVYTLFSANKILEFAARIPSMNLVGFVKWQLEMLNNAADAVEWQSLLTALSDAVDYMVGIAHRSLHYYPHGAVLAHVSTAGSSEVTVTQPNPPAQFERAVSPWIDSAARAIQSIIHLPGHRASSAAEFEYFPTEIGPFRPYHQLYASQLALWTQRSDERLQRVAEILADMGLASDASAVRQMGTAVRVQVGQTLGEQRTVEPLYNVGFGVSEALPIVVALVAAQPGQLVYMEQPEIHLHPRAQRALANAIVAAAQRGVRCVVETHSETMLSTFQMAVVREQAPLNREDVIFHWFERDPVSRASKVMSVTPDEFGAYGAWPQDFGSTSAELDRDYLEAVMRRMSAPPESTPKPKSKPASARPRTTRTRNKPEQA